MYLISEIKMNKLHFRDIVERETKKLAMGYLLN